MIVHTKENNITETKPCKYAVMGASGWECEAWKKVECDQQMKDYNPDGTVNVVECMENEECQ